MADPKSNMSYGQSKIQHFYWVRPEQSMFVVFLINIYLNKYIFLVQERKIVVLVRQIQKKDIWKITILINVYVKKDIMMMDQDV